MCLEIIAQIPKVVKNRVSAKRLSELSGLCVSKVRYDNEPALHFSVNGGCSCGFLDGSADSDSPNWSFREKELLLLEKAVSVIAKESKSFCFLAHWLDGETPKELLKTDSKGLLKDIHSNQVRNNVMYIVGFGR